MWFFTTCSAFFDPVGTDIFYRTRRNGWIYSHVEGWHLILDAHVSSRSFIDFVRINKLIYTYKLMPHPTSLPKKKTFSGGVFFFQISIPIQPPPRWVQPGPRKKVSSKGRSRSARCNCCQVLSAFSRDAVLRGRPFRGRLGGISLEIYWGSWEKSNQKMGG